MISLLMNIACATPSKQQPTTIGPHCSIAWDKTTDQKVTRYQLTVTGQSKQAKKTMQSIPADTTTVSCKDAGANHEGMWSVTVQSCYENRRVAPLLRPYTYASLPSKQPGRVWSVWFTWFIWTNPHTR